MCQALFRPVLTQAQLIHFFLNDPAKLCELLRLSGGPIPDVSNLHSLPSYHGAYVAIWCGLPALIVIAFWILLQTDLVERMVLSGIADGVADMSAYGCLTRMHVVRLLAPALPNEDHTKDIDFSPEGIRQRREAGYRDTCKTLRKTPWRDPVDPMEGFILHEASGGEIVRTPASAD